MNRDASKQAKAAALILAAAMLAPVPPARAKTLEEQLRPDAQYGVSFEYTVGETYADRLAQYRKDGASDALLPEPVVVPAARYSGAAQPPNSVSKAGRDGVLHWEEAGDYIEWAVDAPVSGLYHIGATYLAANENTADIVRALTIDGEMPFDECANLTFHRLWRDKGKPVLNAAGDEVRPGVEQVSGWQTALFRDASGMYDEPLRFYMEQGSHTLRLSMIDEPLYLDSLMLAAPSETPSYKEVAASYAQNGWKPAASSRFFEAEGGSVLHKSSSTLRMSGDGDPLTTPQKTGRLVMNAIGGTSWQAGGAAVTWNFEVPETGLYQIALRLRQNYREGLPSYRRIEIDGGVPFAEFESYKFMYDRNWRTELLSDDGGNAYFIYLESGKPHTMTMTVTQGALAPVTEILKSDSLRLSETVLAITMITGRNPDIHYDYELDRKIPHLLDTLKDIARNMRVCMEIMEAQSGIRPSKYYQMESMIDQLGKMVARPLYIPRRLEDLNTILSTYGEWITQFQMHPLLLDSITLMPAGERAEFARSGFFSRLGVSVANFINSFFKDYDSVTGTGAQGESKTTLDVWIGRGKDWGMLLKQLADEEFTPETGIGVRVNILPAGQVSAGSVNALLLAIASGRAPDVGLAAATDSVGEFAMREAVLDLTEFPDFESVRPRFRQELFIPMTHRGGVYGLPETMKFTCLFYRKDILSRLGLGLPSTWDELYDKIIPVLYQNNMQFFMPGGVQAGVETGFSMFLYQLGGSYYTGEPLSSALGSAEAYRAFKEYTEIFTLYGVPVTASFFNRFRTGEAPVGIGEYGDYMTLLAAAPEITGKWGIAPIPGHRQEDGGILRTHTGILGESAMIMSQSDTPGEAWSFLKWWTGTETQRQFGNEIESLLGKSARWSSANKEAFRNMAWPRDDLAQIEKTYESISQNPVVLGGYFTNRHLYNAFNRVVISGANPRDSLELAVKDINRELKRRRESAAK